MHRPSPSRRARTATCGSPSVTGMGEVDLANDTVTIVDAPNGLAAPEWLSRDPFDRGRVGRWALARQPTTASPSWTDIRFDPQTKDVLRRPEQRGHRATRRCSSSRGPARSSMAWTPGRTADGDGYQPQSIDAVIPTLETTTQLSASPSGTTLGQYVTFTAVVSPTNPVPGVDPLDGQRHVDGRRPGRDSSTVRISRSSSQLVNGQEVATFQMADLAVGDSRRRRQLRWQRAAVHHLRRERLG